MDSPAQVLHGLIDAQAVLSSLRGSKAVMFDLQPAQHSHTAFGQGVALDPRMAQISRHPLEVLFEEVDDLLASSLRLPAALDRPCPELTPGVLHDMEIVVTLWLPLPRRPSEWRCSRPCSHRNRLAPSIAITPN